MKRILALAVVFLLLAAMACGPAKEAPTRVSDDPASTAAPEAAPDPDVPDSDVQEPGTPVPSQEILTDTELCRLDEASVRVSRIRWYQDDYLAIDYKISNPGLMALSFEPRLVAINDWVWFDWYGGAADWTEAVSWATGMHERIDGQEPAPAAGQTHYNPAYLLAGSDGMNVAIITESVWWGTCYYSLSDPANRAMGIMAIDRLSLQISLSTAISEEYYGEVFLKDILVSDAPGGELPPDYTADESYCCARDDNGDIEMGLAPLGYDEASQTLLVYANLPFAEPWDGLRVEAAVNGITFYADSGYFRFPHYEIFITGGAHQAVVCLPLRDALEELGVSAPSMLAVNLSAEGSRQVHLWNIPVDLEDAEPEGDAGVELPVVFKSGDIVLRYAGLSERASAGAAEGAEPRTFLVLEAHSLMDEERLAFWLPGYEFVLNGETYRCDGVVGRVRPGGTARWYGGIAQIGGDGRWGYPGANMLEGQARFDFVYERPWTAIEDYPGARTGPLPVSVTLP